MQPFQESFLNFAIERDVLKFGSFTLKSGRVSPYFFNAGNFHTGQDLSRLGNAYAEAIVNSGIKDLWLADSNFGALKSDIDKAKLICELKVRTGLPHTFATSWSKKHSPKVQEIVLMLHRHYAPGPG